MKKSSAITTSISVIIIVLLLFIQSNAQSPIIPPAIKGKKTLQTEEVNAKPGEIVERITRRDGTSKDIVTDLTEQLSLIVEMKDEPLLLQQLHSTAGALRKTADPHVHLSQFRSDLLALHKAAIASTRLQLPAPVITREFSEVFSGVAVKIPKAMLNKIAALSYVKKVHLNKQVHASLEQSVHQIRADSVWSELGSQGDSVVVGELDTGIDYTDSALGGGLGNKVIYGFNFINDTRYAMDDNGHGTHVAGIIAADGAGLKGVAPHAKLMAFKVLDQNGYGTEDDIIAGIETAVTRHVDIVNMSLGAEPGDPDDAMSTAVDNAVQLGVVFCIAAGNDPMFNSIGSPGTARSAITVGAVDSNDVIAPFSSRGPSPKICSIKPEIVAPGVNILSTYLNNSTATMSGTSMATPHVTGVCALLKSLHRSWTPAHIKSAIMSSAVDIGDEVMMQGAGRVDALNAARVTAFAVPSPLSFGLDSSNFSVWNAADTIWVSNAASQSQSFNVVFDGVQAGISPTANPSSFTVAQNDSQQVIVSLSVDNSVVPFPQQGSFAYSGSAHFNGSKDTLNIPWAFVKAARVMVTSDIPTSITLSNNSFANDYYASPTVEFICPPGVYDLMAFYPPQAIVIKEQMPVPVNGSASFSVSSKDATNLIVGNGVGIGGQYLNSMPTTVFVSNFLFPDSSELMSSSFSGLSDTLQVSDFSNRFTLYQGQSATDGSGNYYNVQFNPSPGLNHSIALTNSVSDYYVANIVMKFPPSGLGSIDYVYYNWINMYNFPFAFGDVASAGLNETRNESYTARMFFTKDKDTRCGFFQTLLGTDSVVAAQYQNLGDWFETLPPRVIGDSVGFCYEGIPPLNDYVIGNGDSVTVGEGAMYTTVGAVNNVYGSSNIYFYPDFYGQLDEYKASTYARTHCALYNSKGNVVAADSSLSNLKPIDVSPDAYSFVADNHDYYVNWQQGHAILTAQFDLRKTDAEPPEFTSLRVLNKNSKITDMLSTGEQGTIEFSAIDYQVDYNNTGRFYYYRYQSINPDSTQLFYREDGTATWNKLAVSKVIEDTTNLGIVYSADLSSTTQFDSAGIDLKFHVVDQSGNSSEWALEPAFGVGKFRGSNSTDTVSNKIININLPAAFALHQNYPNPFNPSTFIQYYLPKTCHVTLKMFDILGREVATLVDEQKPAGAYQVTFDGRSLSSGIYFYRLQAGSFTETKKLVLLK
jgi:subtilisin family serine protease